MAKIIITEEMLGAIATECALNEIEGVVGDENAYNRLHQFVSNLFNRQQQNVIPKERSSTAINPFTSQPGTTPNAIDRNGLNFIAFEETSHNYPYKMSRKDLVGYVNPHDSASVRGHKTYGYGLLCHPNGKFMDSIKPVWTQQELEQIFVQSCNAKAARVLKWAQQNGINLGQNQLTAIVSGMYNYGDTGFLNKPVCALIAKNPNDPKVLQAWRALPSNNKRRQREANLYATDMNVSGAGYSGAR